MKKLQLILLVLLIHNCLFAQRKEAAPVAALIPLPVAVSMTADTFFITANAAIGNAPALQQETKLLQEYVHHATGHALPVQDNGAIVLQLDSSVVKQPEGYQLHITPAQIKITGHDAAGVTHGIETLRQLWRPKGAVLVVPGGLITDYPRFSYRGMHLDVGRHFFSVDFLKEFIDKLAYYKLNNFHWHLTDDQGWRIEIKKYPRLQSVAAWRDQTMIGHKKELPHRFDGKRYGGYYTQEQVREVVAYAAARHINVIPEIEMPGHALAALTAYPSLGCTGGPYKTAQFWGIFDDVFCAGKDSTFLFLQDVLEEVIALFPSSYIHIGGDECPKVRWKACAACQQRMRRENLPDEHALQSYFIRRISDFVKSKGRHIIGWDEILEGGLAPGATVMNWRGVDGAVSAARQQHHVIMTPEDDLYFDHYQSLYLAEKPTATGYTPLEEVYAYEPLRAAADTSLLPFIAGIQGQMWSEYLPDEAQARYMIYPRLQAMAERAWSPQTVTDYSNFTQRLEMQTGAAPAAPYNEIRYSADSIAKGRIYISLRSHLPGAVIRYTTDGSQPDGNSKISDGKSILLQKNTTVKAMLYVSGKPAGRLFQQSFLVHKATGAAISLQEAPNRFSSNAATLVNGIEGTHRYNDEQWTGFSARDLHAVIDLGSVQTVTQLGANTLNYHWQKMWPPVSLQFEASADGVHYQRIAVTDSFPVNGINRARWTIAPLKARYIRVTATNKGVIPPGEYVAGASSMMLIDEIIVN
ncbi:glycoside hydrolase family 20 protein [Chitinophaga solisilvae]|uniref:glycoside hydrolase family 20 protein n=1 Tax=Chitinophaga solisilvae TaxID=1233460 RepID=UPI00136FA017|nr:glycoside hydrolase family 20 protein [Chitinophaga solisilvae]